MSKNAVTVRVVLLLFIICGLHACPVTAASSSQCSHFPLMKMTELMIFTSNRYKIAAAGQLQPMKPLTNTQLHNSPQLANTFQCC